MKIEQKYYNQEVRDAIFDDPYFELWKDNQPFPVYEVKLLPLLKGIFKRGGFRFLNASVRTIESFADLRWGPDSRGQRRLLHPNGICLTGIWKMDEGLDHRYTGYFQPGTKARIIGRYSTCCTETRRNRNRSLSLVGKLFPMNEHEKVVPASFITQEDLGGNRTCFINEAELRNAPDTTFWRRGSAIPVLLLTGLTLGIADREIAFRQTYEIAEMGKGEEPTQAPRFMRIKVASDQPRIDSQDDFRNEIMAQIYDSGDSTPKRKLEMIVEVSDEGHTVGPMIFQRRKIPENSWYRVGKISFDEAVVSYPGDFVIHFHHPAWRNDRNDPNSVARPR